MDNPSAKGPLSPYIQFTRDQWKALRNSTPLSLTEEDLEKIKGINENINLSEVEDVYLPLSRLLNLYHRGSSFLYESRKEFLGSAVKRVPFIIGIAGSVAVGKSTTARLLKTLISSWPERPRVDLVTTDGFLLPNRVLQERGIMNRKGFPESYNLRELLTFLYRLKSGETDLRIPVYSHLRYDIVPEEYETIRSPDIVILEGLNVLQTRTFRQRPEPELLVSDFFDFSIYIDADESYIREWFISRFKVLMKTAFSKSESYFHNYSYLSEAEAERISGNIWDTINLVNLRENILPTKFHAHLILEKDRDHSIKSVKMRKI